MRVDKSVVYGASYTTYEWLHVNGTSSQNERLTPEMCIAGGKVYRVNYRYILCGKAIKLPLIPSRFHHLPSDCSFSFEELIFKRFHGMTGLHLDRWNIPMMNCLPIECNLGIYFTTSHPLPKN